jgi:hypothetical protein
MAWDKATTEECEDEHGYGYVCAMNHFRALLVSLSVLIGSSLFAQEPAKLTCTADLKNITELMGKDVVFCGIPSGIKTFTKEDVKRVYLNFGGTYPNNTFTVTISGRVSGAEHEALEERFNGKEVMVKGRVELYKDKPQIEVQHMEDIQVK